MSDETTAAPAEGTPVPETEQSEATVDSTASQEAEQSVEGKQPESAESTDDKAEKPAEEEGGKEKRKGPSAKERISQLTREKYERDRRLREQQEQYEERIRALEERVSESQPLEKPKWADFDTEEAYERAMEDYASKKTQQEVENSRREQEKQERERKQQLERQQTAQQFASDIQSQKSHYQDFDSVMNDPTFGEITQNYSPDIVSLIQSSDKNVALFYHLGTHLDDAEKIAALPPVQAAREIALIESRLGKPQPKTVTNAPDPVKPTSGSANPKDFSDPKVRDQMTDEEWLEWRNKTKKVM